jgi:hypothetical protein
MDLNIRNVPESLMRLLKLEAAERSMTLRDNVIRKLTGIPSKAELDGMGFDIPEGATVSGYEESEEIEASRRRAAWWADRLKMQGTDPNPDPRTNPDRHDIVIQALRDVCAGKRMSMPAEVGPMDKSKPLAPDARWPDEDPELDRPLAESFAKYPPLSYEPKPHHDPKTCRVYKCGMCSK